MSFVWIVAGKIELRVHLGGKHSRGNVLWHINQNGARATSGGDMVGFLGNTNEIVGFLYEVVVFYYGNSDSENVGLLEGVLAQHPGDLLSADHDHGDGIHLCSHESGDGVSSSWSGSDKNGSGLSGGAGVAVSHVHGALLVTNEDEFHLRFHRFEGVENWNRGSSGISEDVFDSQVIEGFNEGLCSVELLLAHKDCWLRAKSALSALENQGKCPISRRVG